MMKTIDTQIRERRAATAKVMTRLAELSTASKITEDEHGELGTGKEIIEQMQYITSLEKSLIEAIEWHKRMCTKINTA